MDPFLDWRRYIQLSGPLFEAVQTSALFRDGKTFVDAEPLTNPQDILQAYEREKKRPYFDLRQFVQAHFSLPKQEKYSPFKTSSMTDYIGHMWKVLEKKMVPASPYSTLIELPKPHVVPGGRFRECFYWDSYFTALGLLLSGKISMVQNMVENFSSLIERLGYIPNGNRIYFTSRSQPPYFSYLLKALLDHVDETWVLKFMPQLETEYQFWMKGAEELSDSHPCSHSVVRINRDTLLNRYYDLFDFPRPEAYKRESELGKKTKNPQLFRHLRAVCASGWDFSSRWVKTAQDFSSVWALDLIPVDLNCLMYHLEKTLADFSRRLKHREKERYYQSAALARKESIEQIFWDEQRGFYFDYHFPSKTLTDTWSLAGTTPLFAQTSSEKRAQTLASHLEKRFLLTGGFTTTLSRGAYQ
jgi:alpha,alpha-trehalase